MAVAEAAAGSPAGRPVSTAEQLGFEGMPRRLFAATPSRLGTFTSCPRRYRLTYLVRPTPAKGAPWAHNSMGAAVHNALRDWWLLPARRRSPGAAGALLDAGWISDGFADAGQSARWRARARGWVEAYVATLDPADEPIGVERGVAARTERLALSGRVDRIDLRDGRLVVVDYKTGRSVPDTDDARGSLALAVYVLAARQTLRRPAGRVELHHLPTGRVAAWEHTERVAGPARCPRREHRGRHRGGRGRGGRRGHPDEAFPPATGPAVRRGATSAGTARRAGRRRRSGRPGPAWRTSTRRAAPIPASTRPDPTSADLG